MNVDAKNIQVELYVVAAPILVHSFTLTSIAFFDTIRRFLGESSTALFDTVCQFLDEG